MKYIQRYGGIIACLLLLTGCVTQEIVETPAIVQEVAQESSQEEVVTRTVDEVIEDVEVEIATPTKTTAQEEVIVKEEGAQDADTEIEEVYEPQERVISVLMKRYEFVPSVIKVRKGDTVTLTVTSEEVAHGFFLPTFGVNLKTAPGESATTTFIADKEGSYSFRCNVYCGEGHASMEGLFIVE